MMQPVNSERGREILTIIPKYYETSRIMRAIVEMKGIEFDKIRQAVLEVFDQYFARSATWDLTAWEEELGLPPAPPDQPIEERRDRVVSKLRGYGTCNSYLVKNVSEAYDGGIVAVADDFRQQLVTVTFISTFGIPANIDDLKNAIRTIVPAHVDIDYRFRYLTWDDLDAANVTWDELDALDLTWDEFETWRP